MAWIESHQELAKHPKTRKFRRLLDITLPAAIGHLHFLWWWALDFAQDGSLANYDEFDIADACYWEGDEKEFFNALVESGFIDRTDEGHVIHDWFEYGGKLIKWREKDAERKRKSRGKKTDSNDNPEDVQRTSSGQRKESTRNSYSNSKSNKDKTLTRKKSFDEDSLPYKIAAYHHKKIMEYAESYGKSHLVRNADLQKWADEYRKMLEIDKVSKDEIRQVIDWVSQDNFWRTNVLSAKKMREKFPELSLKMVSSTQPPQPKIDKTLEFRRREIAFQRWIEEGGDPSEFDFRSASNH